MPPSRDRDVHVPVILERVRLRLGDLPRSDVALVEATLARIQPPEWTLEWQLPWWLGATFGLAPEIAGEIVVSNVLGLAGVRLEDDAVDGELQGEDPVRGARLARELLGRAIGVYRPLFAPGSPFWHDADSMLMRWRASREHPGLDQLADRAAPLLIGARAVTLLAGRDSRWPAVERCLRVGAVALAYLDDIADWELDLQAGRWNAFISDAGARDQGPTRRDANRAIVLVSMLASGETTRALERVRVDAARAAGLARRLDCPPLADHFGSIAARAVELAGQAERHYGALADRMTQLILGPRISVDQAGAGGVP